MFGSRAPANTLLKSSAEGNCRVCLSLSSERGSECVCSSPVLAMAVGIVMMLSLDRFLQPHSQFSRLFQPAPARSKSPQRSSVCCSTAGLHHGRKKNSETHSHLSPSIVHDAQTDEIRERVGVNIHQDRGSSFLNDYTFLGFGAAGSE